MTSNKFRLIILGSRYCNALRSCSFLALIFFIGIVSCKQQDGPGPNSNGIVELNDSASIVSGQGVLAVDIDQDSVNDISFRGLYNSGHYYRESKFSVVALSSGWSAPIQVQHQYYDIDTIVCGSVVNDTLRYRYTNVATPKDWELSGTFFQHGTLDTVTIPFVAFTDTAQIFQSEYAARLPNSSCPFIENITGIGKAIGVDDYFLFRKNNKTYAVKVSLVMPYLIVQYVAKL